MSLLLFFILTMIESFSLLEPASDVENHAKYKRNRAAANAYLEKFPKYGYFSACNEGMPGFYIIKKHLETKDEAEECFGWEDATTTKSKWSLTFDNFLAKNTDISWEIKDDGGEKTLFLKPTDKIWFNFNFGWLSCWPQANWAKCNPVNPDSWQNKLGDFDGTTVGGQPFRDCGIDKTFNKAVCVGGHWEPLGMIDGADRQFGSSWACWEGEVKCPKKVQRLHKKVGSIYDDPPVVERLQKKVGSIYDKTWFLVIVGVTFTFGLLHLCHRTKSAAEYALLEDEI